LEGDKVINVGPDEKGTAVYSALSEKLLPNTETPAAGAILCGDLLTVTGIIVTFEEVFAGEIGILVIPGFGELTGKAINCF
jgi:hypothetical protein